MRTPGQLSLGTMKTAVSKDPDGPLLSMPARFRHPKSWTEVDNLLPYWTTHRNKREMIPSHTSGLLLLRGWNQWRRVVRMDRMKGQRILVLQGGTSMPVDYLKSMAVFITSDPDDVWYRIEDGTWEEYGSADDRWR